MVAMTTNITFSDDHGLVVHEYSDESWHLTAEAVRMASEELTRTRELVRTASVAYGKALETYQHVQQERDTMIVADHRPSATISRLAGVSRPRVSQIRAAAGRRSYEVGSDSRRLLALAREHEASKRSAA